MSPNTLSDEEILEVEDKQSFLFLTDVRPVGEEKSELYPEPKYFYIGFMTMVLTFPKMLEAIRARGTEADYATRMKRVLARSTALHSSGTHFVATWAREMWLLERGGLVPDEALPADPDTTVMTIGDFTFTEADFADVMRFAFELQRAHRNDGEAYPSPTRGLGADYAILDDEEAARIAASAQPVDADVAREVLGLWAGIRSLSFLMEAETRDALMMHGPYPVEGHDSRVLVIYECNDLRWSLFERFPLPGGARWELPEEPFPYPNLAIGIVFDNVEVEADRMGTLYLEPWKPENVVAATLMSRGTDEWSDGELKSIDISEARALRRAADDLQGELFLQIADWEPIARLAAGHFQKLMFPLRMLSGAGLDRSEIEAQYEAYETLSLQAFDLLLQPVFDAPDADLRFYAKLEKYLTGEIDRMYTTHR
jgi:hypothetical protein